MYEELVKRLRSHNGWALNKTLDEAADAIEELSKERKTEERCADYDGYSDGELEQCRWSR